MAKTLNMHTEQREIFARILRAKEKVRERLVRVSGLPAQAQIPYTTVGGHAVSAWVATKAESLVRMTRDADVHVRPTDLERIREVLEADGFVCRHVELIYGIAVRMDTRSSVCNFLFDHRYH